MRCILLLGLAAVVGCAQDDETLVTSAELPTPTIVAEVGRVVLTVAWSNVVLDFATGQPVAGAELKSQGISPPVAAVANAQGGFSVTVPSYGVFPMAVAREGLVTINSVRAYDVIERPLFAVAASTVASWYAAAGVVQARDRATVLVDTRYGNGVPMAGVELQLYPDRFSDQVLGRAYYLDDNGALGPALTRTKQGRYGRDPKAVAVFLNVPPSPTLDVYARVRLPDQQGDARTTTPPVEAGMVVYVGMNATPWTDEGTAGELRTVAYVLKADGCIACHQPGGAMGSLDFSTDAMFTAPSLEGLRQRLLARPGVINLAKPTQSRLLTKPLFENPADHPTATYMAQAEPGFQSLLTWIMAGAPAQP